MTAALPAPRETTWSSGTSLTADTWRRMLTALDAGAPPAAACRYAGISLAAWRFLQGAAASEWRAALEVVKLYGATRGRGAVRVDEPDDADLDSELTPDDVAAVIRVLRGHEVTDHVDGEPAPDGHTNGRAAR